jgi:hypothetical protein
VPEDQPAKRPANTSRLLFPVLFGCGGALLGVLLDGLLVRLLL